MSASPDDFRKEIRAWLEDYAPRSLRGKTVEGFDGIWGGRNFTFPDRDHETWMRVAAERGLTAPLWPKAYGGGGLSRAEARIADEEMRRLGLPLPLIGLGLAMIGPTLLECASEEQKLEHLPAICRGEIRWCQGFSEPGAGSDLASLRTRAQREGDLYRVNGQKIWTSYANLSDWIFALVRTDPSVPKHEGISFLLIDLKSTGVTVKPIRLISGHSPFCEVFFDDVLVPARQLIGGENRGWSVAKTLLGFERKAVSESMGARSLLGGMPKRQRKAPGTSALGELAKRYLPQRYGRLLDDIIRDEIADVEMHARSLQLAMQLSAELAREGTPGPEGSALKLVGTELNQRRQALRMALMGPRGLGWEGGGFDEDELDTPRAWLRSRANTIEGGTTEVQLNIVAKRILNL